MVSYLLFANAQTYPEVTDVHIKLDGLGVVNANLEHGYCWFAERQPTPHVRFESTFPTVSARDPIDRGWQPYGDYGRPGLRVVALARGKLGILTLISPEVTEEEAAEHFLRLSGGGCRGWTDEEWLSGVLARNPRRARRILTSYFATELIRDMPDFAACAEEWGDERHRCERRGDCDAFALRLMSIRAGRNPKWACGIPNDPNKRRDR